MKSTDPRARRVPGTESAAELVVRSPAALAIWRASLARIRGASGHADETA